LFSRGCGSNRDGDYLEEGMTEIKERKTKLLALFLFCAACGGNPMGSGGMRLFR
jgi:hypothetical protein